MKKNAKFKQILSCILLAIVSLVIGYTILMPNEKTEGKNSPLAVMIDNGSGTYTQQIIKSFDELPDDTYAYDHIDCGSAAENAKWSWNNGTLSATRLNAHTTCKVYFKEFSGLRITSITVDGNQASSVPTQMKYYVQPNCTGVTATWNYESWSLDISAFSSAKATCSLAFTTITSSNLATKFTSSAASGKYLSTYIKSLVNTFSGDGQINGYGTTNAISNGTTSYYHDIGIRYVGANPDNYIMFNNELWRIIGVFREAKTSPMNGGEKYYTKIIRNESIGGYAYNGVSNGGWWSKSNGTQVSTLNYLLNHYYIGADSENYDGTSDTTNCRFYSTIVTRNCDYRVIGIQPGWRDMIRSTTWYTAAGVNSSTASTSFSGERGSTAGKAEGELSYTGKVGLMYPSDYLYSGSSASSRWLLQYGLEWTISPSSSSAGLTWYYDFRGTLTTVGSLAATEVRPVVYLSDSVYVIGGSGTLLDPYIING